MYIHFGLIRLFTTSLLSIPLEHFVSTETPTQILTWTGYSLSRPVWRRGACAFRLWTQLRSSLAVESSPFAGTSLPADLFPTKEFGSQRHIGFLQLPLDLSPLGMIQWNLHPRKLLTVPLSDLRLPRSMGFPR